VSSELNSQSLLSYGKYIYFSMPVCVINVLYTLNCSDAGSLLHVVATLVFDTLQLSYIGLCLVCRHAHNLLLNYAREAAVGH